MGTGSSGDRGDNARSAPAAMADLGFPIVGRLNLGTGAPVPGVREARRAQARLRALLSVSEAVSGEGELDLVLRRIAEAARELVGAEYAALGVLGTGGEMVAFEYAGIDEQAAERIGRLPSGLGILGRLIDDPRPLRLENLGEHDASVGLPAGHPHMRSFLGVPIRIRGRVYGNLYLAEKTEPRGQVGGSFTEQDEQLLVSLAASAAVVIDNARLLREARRREIWQEASWQITQAQREGGDPDAVLSLITERAAELSGGDVALLMLSESRAGVLRIRSAVGRDTAQMTGRQVPLNGSFVGSAVQSGRSWLSEDVGADEREDASSTGLPPGLGPCMMVPFADLDSSGSILVARERGRAAFTGNDLESLAGFAARGALARQLDRNRVRAGDCDGSRSATETPPA